MLVEFPTSVCGTMAASGLGGRCLVSAWSVEVRVRRSDPAQEGGRIRTGSDCKADGAYNHSHAVTAWAQGDQEWSVVHTDSTVCTMHLQPNDARARLLGLLGPPLGLYCPHAASPG